MSLICVTLTGESVSEFFESARKCKALGADLFELRLDFLKENATEHSLSELSRLKDEVGLPVILTIRPSWEGGSYGSSEESRLALLGKGIELGFDYIDLELKTEDARRNEIINKAIESGVTTIVSHHDYIETPSSKDILFLMKQCLEADGDIAKVVTTAHEFMDGVDVILAGKEAKSQNLRFTVMGMGRFGYLTRFLGPVAGCEMVYASLERGEEAVYGQVDIQTLNSIRIKKINFESAVCGIIGFPLGHSLSPLMHNAGFKELNLNFVYIPMEFPEEQLGTALEGIRSLGFKGLSVTHPYKRAVMNYLDGIDERASDIGAVNTILNNEGEFIGYNTDSSGAVGALRDSGIDIWSGKDKTLIIGAGGAARAIGVPLAKAGWEIIVANRTPAKGKNLADMLNSHSSTTAISISEIGDAVSDINLLINCTPLGMKGYPSESPIPVNLLRKDITVFDMVYSPMRTPLLMAAEKVGAKVIYGHEMFVRQGVEAFELWTQGKAPVDVMRKVVMDELGEGSI